MRFNLNEFLISVSFALDFIEMDVLGTTTNHSKRVAYIALKTARNMGLKDDELHDLVALSILHDNGISEKRINDRMIDEGADGAEYIEGIKEHCIIGEDNIKDYPFLTDVRNVIKYHHEKHDGSGFFKLKGGEIPLMAEIIQFADNVEIQFHKRGYTYDLKDDVFSYVRENSGKSFSPEVSEAFLLAADKKVFWEELGNDAILEILKSDTPISAFELPLTKVHAITGVLSSIIDAKSRFTYRHSTGLSEKAGKMADYYHMSDEKKMKLIIAADLHDIGKLAVPNRILDKPGKLNEEELKIVKDHPAHTRKALEGITGFEEITEWASNHHERLDGSGYPHGLKAEQQDFNTRLMACLDVYQALAEERPYRRELTHKEAMDIMLDMKKSGILDENIIDDIDTAFKEIKG